LHEDDAVAVSNVGPVLNLSNPTCLTGARTVLIASQHFVLERIDLPKDSSWALLADPETWIFVLDGHAAVGLVAASAGQAIFVGGDRTSIEVGTAGLSGLIAYPGPNPSKSLLQNLGKRPANCNTPVELAAPRTADTVEAQT
jgi:mannose-6-phosphate isomerase